MEHYGYLALLALWALALKGDRRFRLLALLATVWTGYIASVGGDWIPHYRFLVPLVPVAATATATALVFIWKLLGERVREGARTPARAGLVLLAASAVVPAALLQVDSVRDDCTGPPVPPSAPASRSAPGSRRSRCRAPRWRCSTWAPCPTAPGCASSTRAA